MINFVKPVNIWYGDIMSSFIEPIGKHLTSFFVSETSRDNCVNVHFFNEQSYVKQVGLKGINVIIPHGLADKRYRDSKENIFQYSLASSELWKSRLVNRGIKEEKIFIGGYAKIDTLLNNKKDTSDKKTILWSPTHNINLKNLFGISSFPYFNEFINMIPDKYNVNISPHPYNKIDHKATINELVNADVVISDFSSIIFESLAIGKPVIFPDWIVRKAILSYYSGTFEGYMYLNDIGYHANSIEELVNYIDIALNNGIDEKTKDFIEEILPTKFRGSSGKTIADFLVNLDIYD
jgi:CDP-glycerol glycerophosphotransferase (TagB/SpsB family)